jgi:predicted RNA-binding protein (TIGR00451 family)
MRPGITKIDPQIKKGELVKIVDERNNRALAVGKSMFNAAEMEAKSSGKVIKNLHTIKDNIWQFEKQFK